MIQQNPWKLKNQNIIEGQSQIRLIPETISLLKEGLVEVSVQPQIGSLQLGQSIEINQIQKEGQKKYYDSYWRKVLNKVQKSSDPKPQRENQVESEEQNQSQSRIN